MHLDLIAEQSINVSELMSRFEINGAIPITMDDIRKLIDDQLSSPTSGPFTTIMDKLKTLETNKILSYKIQFKCIYI